MSEFFPGEWDFSQRRLCHFGSAVLGVLGVGSDVAAYAAPVIDAAAGAGISAATGGNPLTGAVLGGGLGIAGDVTGASGAVDTQFGNLGAGTQSLGDTLSNLGTGALNYIKGAPATSSIGTGAISSSQIDAQTALSNAITNADPTTLSAIAQANQAAMDAGGTGLTPGQIGAQLGLSGDQVQALDAIPNTTALPAGITGTATQAASALGNTVANGGKAAKSIGSTDLLLGGAGALASYLAGPPKVSTQAMPGPSTTAATQGPLWNTALAPGVSRTAVSNPNSIYTNYGQVPSYFTNNAPPFPTVPAVAQGGSIGALTMMSNGGREFSTNTGQHHVTGSGSGQSDSIPAQLSDGEFVFDASTVSRLGDGSNKAGAEMLERMRKLIARDAGSQRVVQKKVKPPEHYLEEARR